MSDEVMADLRAALADRYAIERELGRGGMSVVYLAQDRKHDRRVAVKVLRAELAAAVGHERFHREIQIAANLQHPSILPLFDSGEASGRLYYVMPFVEGESLRGRLERETQIPLNEALQITCDVAEGLGHAHARGVVHRDIKPENILLSGGRAVIADFGVASAVTEAAGDRLTDSGIVVGTPAYMSPEQAAGGHADGRSDLWSLGCVLYEMLAGEPPFTGPNSQAVIARVLHDAPHALRVVRPTVPTSLETTVERALAKVPADRFATASELLDHLRTADSAAATTLPRVTSRGAGLLVIASVGIALVWMMLFLRGGPERVAEVRPMPEPTRVAVLYFEDRSERATLRHVARGLTEDLIDELSQVEPLRVISPAGVRPFSERTVPLDSVARALNVGTLVEGTVASLGDRLRVSVRLVDGMTAQQVGHTVVERPWSDLLTLQTEVAAEVSRYLRQRLGRELQLRQRREGTAIVGAWELVQRAEELREDATALADAGDWSAAARGAARADSLLADAEQLDPKWNEPILLRGWITAFQAQLAMLIQMYEGGRGSGGNGSPAEWLRAGLVHAERAGRGRAEDPRVLELRGVLRSRLLQLGTWPSDTGLKLLRDAENDFERAVALDPTRARAWSELSLIRWNRGEFAEAVVMGERALTADAYLRESAAIMQVLMIASLELGQFADAFTWCAKGQQRFAGDPRFAECQLTLLGWSGRTDRDVTRGWELVAAIERADSTQMLAQTWPYRRAMVAAVLARRGRADSALRVLEVARRGAPLPQTLAEFAFYEAYIQTLLQQPDTALALLKQHLDAYPDSRSYVARTRWFEPLRADPRFRTLVSEPALVP